MIVCAGASESFEFAKSIGIGLVEPAINLTNTVSNTMPKWILFVGTAGSYGSIKVGSICLCQNAVNIEISSLLELSYTPINTSVITKLPEHTNTLTDTNNILTDVVCNSSNFITKDSAMADKFIKMGIDIENMELYSVFSVARKFDIPCAGLLYVTNLCDTNAHNDFIKNHETAKKALIKLIKTANF
ncbi:purine-nucleoside phosphorylase [Campylobacter sp. 19-13652]|uniref:phosphorylase family protein n=1 Tax=Campylobacter sp. 19-13652 TaxID=2840180 RepID=UPI001C75D6BA|nr:purine-nucleoside phosphorylase [Campylobacter sp. 19-13652]BCX78615.1 purine-nucleoside phosphorylase [Campylobacter sp. 19-13652]